MLREINFTIEWCPNGLPVTKVDRDAHLNLRIQSAADKNLDDPNLPPQMGTVELRGNRAGLLALAERLIAVAYTDIEAYHEHLDGEYPPGLLQVDGDGELLVGRSDRRAIRKAKECRG